MTYWLLLNGALLLGAYLLGALAPGYWIARGFYGIDLREQGSGSTGATNVLRSCGKVPAVLVLMIDLFKGTASVLLIYRVYALPWTQTLAASASIHPEIWANWIATLAGLTALIGHTKSIWIGFKGGKAVATGLGVLFGLNWILALATLGIFLLMLGISRIVSLSSLVAALGIVGLMVLGGQPLPYQVFAIAAAIYIFWRHQANIERLLKGAEPKIGQKLQGEA
ncbi:MAG: glycerol-3-phosphate 1-O-acyltransferase PlsY [Oscillatoriales cyanobacterium RM2_1_1]|nr:glycerol-3-phosphate 1-O-acyltransferase PlsY [Oscillatoriales cyanobacterium SM2_3_0]NJO46222.1 glycerol-3-phosphate 1-O-acyltransferase PlsY [Oscillatoriales cyanobacterium RM2_1_1]